MLPLAAVYRAFHIPEVPFNLETCGLFYRTRSFWRPLADRVAADLRLIDEITETRGRGNKECIGQGVANTMTGFFGGMGGCAMIGQSMINVNSGGRGRLSGISAALFLLLVYFGGSPVIEQIPLAA